VEGLVNRPLSDFGDLVDHERGGVEQTLGVAGPNHLAALLFKPFCRHVTEESLDLLPFIFGRFTL